jgi:NAD(P)-dependent dehydrogenase (short-subunit alcohol dehydrogenase family)
MTANAFGGIDIAFNNAGISFPDDNGILETEIATWVKVQQTNLTSVCLCCKEAIPRLRQRGGGVIINTASFVAVMGAATSQISYTASKGGVLALSRDLVCSSPAKASRVIDLCPGPVRTPLLEELFANDPIAAERRLVPIPMGRFARPEDIAAAVAFLGQRRRVVHHCHGIPRRWRHLRCLRHPAVRWMTINAGRP